MDQTKLTPHILEASLRALRRGESPAPELLSVTGLSGTHAEKFNLAFETRLYDLVWETYSALRQAEELPAVKPNNRQEVLRQIAENFRSQNGELAAWTALYSRYFSGIDISVKDMSQAAGVVSQQFRRRLNLGLALLTQKLLRLAPQSDHPQRPNHANLPLPDFTSLVGVNRYFALLTRLFSASDGPLLVSLEGFGGIGKSALARAFISLPETAANWQKVAWVSARQHLVSEDGHLSSISGSVNTLEDITARLCDQMDISSLAARPLAQRLEGLKTALTQEKYLIVIDNLETVEEYLRLVPTLAKLAGVSRFLLTTRQTLREFAFVHTIPIAALDRESAFDLMRVETARRGHLNHFSEETFNELFAVIGGHPLALKLVAAQLYLRPIGEILKGFRQASLGMDGLYRYLYWQTWHALGDPARRLLLSFLPSDPDGEDLEFLQIMSGQAEDEFYQALKELGQFSLLEGNGDVERPLYRLHSLTVTFLQTDILNFWSDKTG